MNGCRIISRLSLAVRTAAVVLVGAVAGCAGPMGSGGEGITVVAEFDNGAGLYVGNAVAVLGMDVGEVTAVEPRGSRVEVTMRIDEGVRIPADASAVTLSTSVLTDRHVEFTPVYRDGPVLADGARLGRDRTRTPVEFERLLGAAETMAGELAEEQPGAGPVARLLGVSAEIAARSGPDLRATMAELAEVLRMSEDGGAEWQATVTRLADELAVLAGSAADNDQLVRDFATNTGMLTDLLADLRIGEGRTGARIEELMRGTEALLTDNAEALRSTVADANTVTRALADYRRELAEFLDVTPLLLDNAYAAVDFEYRGVRVHALLDKVFFDGQLVKEFCNVLGLRQLGCATGTLQDFGPDFGITDMLTAMAEMPR
ncbi:MCE family protein [Nocardia higoensis]|uniref:MCE family protein n=1 Tax=Nocardia higoensis TaxID=228599 RepID=UPI00030A73D6|nr:MCE family protein [Nocardia higoensis]